MWHSKAVGEFFRRSQLDICHLLGVNTTLTTIITRIEGCLVMKIIWAVEVGDRLAYQLFTSTDYRIGKLGIRKTTITDTTSKIIIIPMFSGKIHT